MEKFELNKDDLRALLYLCNARGEGVSIEMFLIEFIKEYYRERSKREDSLSEQTGFKQFLEETFDRRMEIVEQLQNERDAVL